LARISRKICTTVLLLGALHCSREPDPAPLVAAPAGPLSSAPPPTLELGSVPPPPTEEEARAAVVPASLKTVGAQGDELETDLHSFKVLSLRTCGKLTGSAAAEAAETEGMIAVGLEVQITAKTTMAIAPRDVLLRSGGTLFHAGLDLQQKRKGCIPVLQSTRLKARQAARGFVLFEMPSSMAGKLELTYQPTRWGGATPVHVALENLLPP